MTTPTTPVSRFHRVYRPDMAQQEWEQMPRTCDHATCEDTHLGQHSHSFIVGYTTLSTQGAHYTQCSEQQHFHCSHACASETLAVCVQSHERADGVMLPLNDEEQVLLAEGTCVICRGAFRVEQEAYLFRVVYAMPGWSDAGQPYPAFACLDDHWCCSRLHAEQAALLCLAEHLESGQHG